MTPTFLLAALSVIDMAAGSVSRKDPGKGTLVRDLRGTKVSREHVRLRIGS